MEGRGRIPGQGGQGLDKEHEISRTNPETGEEETRTITQREWKDSGKQLRDEGWTRDEDEAEEGEEAEVEAPDAEGDESA
jgi:hypothetical protein